METLLRVLNNRPKMPLEKYTSEVVEMAKKSFNLAEIELSLQAKEYIALMHGQNHSPLPLTVVIKLRELGLI